MKLPELTSSKRLWQRRAKKRRANVKRKRQQLSAAKQALARARGLVARRSRQIARADRGPQAALRWALAQAGTVEQPAGSNRGPKISAWQLEIASMDGQPWCGAFVGKALKQAGVAVSPRVVYTPYIAADGRSGSNGMLKIVPASQAKAGDLVLFDFDRDGVIQHVGLVRRDYSGGGLVYTVEGNTSSGSGGSQDNGGGVFLRTRPMDSTVKAIVRPRYV